MINPAVKSSRDCLRELLHTIQHSFLILATSTCHSMLLSRLADARATPASLCSIGEELLKVPQPILLTSNKNLMHDLRYTLLWVPESTWDAVCDPYTLAPSPPSRAPRRSALNPWRRPYIGEGYKDHNPFQLLFHPGTYCSLIQRWAVPISDSCRGEIEGPGSTSDYLLANQTSHTSDRAFPRLAAVLKNEWK